MKTASNGKDTAMVAEVTDIERNEQPALIKMKK
jgi:hypothetical protein